MIHRTLRSLPFVLSILAAEACASPTGYSGARIDGVPHVLQRPDFCGEACAEMVLRTMGLDIDQNDVFASSGLDPALGRGCHTLELGAALRRLGFDIGAVWHRAPAARRADALEGLWADLHRDLAAGVPSIVCTRFDEQPGASEHFRLVLGYDAGADEVLYHEPAEAGGAYRRMSRDLFLALWPLKYDEQAWMVIRLRLDRSRFASAGLTEGAAPPRKSAIAAADLAQHVRELRARLPAPGFTIVVEPPFVVAGDEAPETVRQRSKSTVRWAVDRLKDKYFAKDPVETIDIWLFRDKKSYEENARKLFGEVPHTPYGYYSHRHRALVMNIATGGGTLVHEIVHPFIEANFPRCPAWFNEGLASLYEQSDEVAGKIRGLTNWRLDGLQRAIRGGRLPSFAELTATTSAEFYGDARGTSYAQARYLCYYLEEKGLLTRFYREFAAGCEADPGGLATLQAVLGEKDIRAFQKRWETFVLELKFP